MNNLDAATSRWTNVDATTFKYAGNTLIPILAGPTQATFTAITTTTSSTFAVTSTTATITPKSTASRILIIATGVLSVQSDTGVAYATLANGGSNLFASNGIAEVMANIAGHFLNPCTLVAVHSPASVAAQTYAVYIKNADNAKTAQWGDTNVNSTITLMELGV